MGEDEEERALFDRRNFNVEDVVQSEMERANSFGRKVKRQATAELPLDRSEKLNLYLIEGKEVEGIGGCGEVKAKVGEKGNLPEEEGVSNWYEDPEKAEEYFEEMLEKYDALSEVELLDVQGE